MLSAEREAAYLEIVERGILNVRTQLGRGDVERALVEANHIHNLPALLRGGSGQSETEYWEVARAGYLRDSKPGWPSVFRQAWETVAPSKLTEPVTPRASSSF